MLIQWIRLLSEGWGVLSAAGEFLEEEMLFVKILKKFSTVAIAAAMITAMAAASSVSVSATVSSDGIVGETVGITGSFCNWGSDGDEDIPMTEHDGVWEGTIEIDSVTEDMLTTATRDDGLGAQIPRTDITGPAICFKVRTNGDWTNAWGDYEPDYVRTWNSQTNCAVEADVGDSIVINVKLDTTTVVEQDEIPEGDYDAWQVWPVTYTCIRNGETIEYPKTGTEPEIGTVSSVNEQDGVRVEISADKASYAEDEEIEATFTITNTNDEAIYIDSVKNLVPDGYEVKGGISTESGSFTLDAGTTISDTVVLVPVSETSEESSDVSDESDDSTDSKPEDSSKPEESSKPGVSVPEDSSKPDVSVPGETSTVSTVSVPSQTSQASQASLVSQPGKVSTVSSVSTVTSDGVIKTGDNAMLPVVVTMIVLGSAFLTVVCVKSKKGKKLLSVVLTVSIVGGSSVLVLNRTSAAEDPDLKSFTTELIVDVNGKDVRLAAEINYDFVPDGEKDEYCTVSFDTDGGSEIADVVVEKGSTISAPENPEKEGYIFVGWYMDPEFDTVFLFDEDVITEDITLYALWIKDDPDALAAEAAVESIVIGYASGDSAENVTRDITLPESSAGVELSWSSSAPEIISADGKVTRPQDENAEVVMTAVAKVGDTEATKEFNLTVIAETTTVSTRDYSVIDIQNMNGEEEAEIEYNSERTRVVSISGKFSETAVKNSEDALTAIFGIRTIAGFTNPFEELELLYSSSDEYGKIFKFNQVYSGYQVYDHIVVVAADAEGVTQSFDSDIVSASTLSGVDLTVGVEEDAAVETVKTYFDSEFEVLSKSTVIYASNDYESAPVLTYMITAGGNDSEGDYSELTVFVKAADGSVADIVSEIDGYSTKGKAKNEQKVYVKFPVSLDTASGIYYMEDEVNKVSLIQTGAGARTEKYSSDVNAWSDRTAVSAYTNMLTVKDWYKTNLGWDFAAKYGHDLEVVVHSKANTNNAAWNGSKEKIFFYDNSSAYSSLNTYAACLDVAGHEYTHSVVENIMGDMHYNRDYRGAINEGYADIFGCLIEGDWEMAEDREILRDASDPAAYDAPVTINDETFLDPYTYITDEEYANKDRSSEDYKLYHAKISRVAHRDSSMLYHAAYLMESYGMSKDTLAKLWYKSMEVGSWNSKSNFLTVRRKVVQAGKLLSLSDSEMAMIRLAFDTEEIYDERGNVSLSFVDSEGNPFTEDVSVTAELTRFKSDVPNTSVVIGTTTLGTTLQKDVYTGTYKLVVTIPGYKTFESNVSVTRNKTTEVTVPVVAEGRGVVTGTITSATTGQPVGGVTLKIYNGWNQRRGTVVKTYTTNAETGKYRLALASGSYTVEMSKEGYSKGYFNITVIGGKTTANVNASISPTMEFSNNFRVVLTWNENPRDIDSHLIGTNQSNASDYHVYYSDKNAYDADGNKVANLDVDDTDGVGPETTTFTAETDGCYEFFIYWYAGEGTWATSGAKVEVYNNDRLMYVFDAPPAETNGGVWEIFTFDHGIFTPYDQILEKPLTFDGTLTRGSSFVLI